MKQNTSQIIDDAMEGDVLDEILLPETELALAQLTKLSTDYSCQGCAF